MAQQVSPSNPLQVRSLEKWKRVFQDELDMGENEEFLVLKTSMCGWWYAVNKNQEDGLIPYMYLEILSDYVDYSTITQHEFRHIESTVLAWDINNICKLIFQDQKASTQEQNILLHSLRNLYIMCQKQDCRYTFLSKGGLDRLHEILKKTFDIAIRTFCLRALILLAPSIEARRFPAQTNLTEGILGVMNEYMDMPSFVCICTDGLSNVSFQNERQRMLASKTNAVEMLLYSMDRHRTVFKVQLQASRSLANMISDPKIQRQIDDKGVQTLLNSLNNIFGQQAVDNALQKQMQQDQNNPNQQQNQQNNHAMFDKNKGQFAQQMLTILSYITTDPRKAQAFGRLGGWQALKTIQNSIGVWDEAVRATIVGMLNNMSQNPAIAKCFFDNNYEGYDIMFDMCLEAEPYSLYFYQIFSVITFISCKCDKQQLPQVICHAFDRKQLARLMNDALQQSDNERLMDTVPTICALTARTKDQKALQYIYNSMVPMHLLKICGTQPGPPNDQFLNYTLITIYNLTDDVERIDPFIQNGVVEAIAGSEWYKDPHKDPHVTQNGIASLVNICAKTQRPLLPQQEQMIKNMIQICFQVHPKLKPLIQKLDVALKKAQAIKGKKKNRNARNKRNKNNNRQGNNVPQGAYNPQSGSYQGQQNAQRPANYNPNQQQQQMQNNNNNFNGPVQSGLVERPYQDENNFNNQPQQNQQYGSQMNFGNNNQGGYNNGPPQQQQQQQNQYGSQMNMNNNRQGGYNNGPPQQQNQYGSQANFGPPQNNMGPPQNNNQNPYQSQNNMGPPQNNMGPPQNNQNPYQSQNRFNAPPNNQNPYQSQNNFGNPNMQQQNNNNLGNNMQQPQKNESLYGKDKWDTDSDDNNQDDSSSEDEWEKQKKAKIAAVSQVGGNNNQNQGGGYGGPPQQQQQQQQPPYGSQMNMNNQQGGFNNGPPQQQNQYGSQANFGGNQGGGPPQGQQQQQNNSAWQTDSSDDEQPQQQGNQWGGPPQGQQQQQQQQQPYGSQMNMNNNQQGGGQPQQRDYMGFNQMQQRQQGGYQGSGNAQNMNNQQQQQQQPPQQQQQGGKGKKGKKKKKFKLFG